MTERPNTAVGRAVSPASCKPAGCLCAALFIVLCPVRAQGPQDEQEVRIRQLRDTNLLSRRPPGPKAAPRRPSGADDALIGVTLWRLRPSRPGDETGVRALIHEDQATTE